MCLNADLVQMQLLAHLPCVNKKEWRKIGNQATQPSLKLASWQGCCFEENSFTNSLKIYINIVKNQPKYDMKVVQTRRK